MKLKITHQTSYIYQYELVYLLQVLHLQPMQTPWQNVLHHNIKTIPSLHLKAMIDMHGNHIHILNIVKPEYPIFHLDIQMQTMIETQNIYRFDFKIIQDARFSQKISTPFNEKFREMNSREEINPIHYLRSGHLTQPNTALNQAAQQFLALKHAYLNVVRDILQHQSTTLTQAPEMPSLIYFEGMLLAFASEICQKIPYQSAATHSQTSAAEAFALGAGVCQDHAHIALAILRSLDIPARYVSGYFYDPYHPNMASHAWIDVMLPIGFISLDISHQRFTNDAYVRLAHGFDYQDVSLVKGVREGGGHEKLTHKVDVLDFWASINMNHENIEAIGINAHKPS